MVVAAKAYLGAHPYVAILVGVDIMYEVVEERAFLLLVVIVGGHRIAVVFAQAITCSYPDISFVIFSKRLHFLIGHP